MRLMIVGSLGGHISTAGKIALEKGAKVIHTESIEQTLNTLRAGNGADVIMVDVRLKIGDLIDSLAEERIVIPVVACGVEMDTKAAVNAIRDARWAFCSTWPTRRLMDARFDSTSPNAKPAPPITSQAKVNAEV